MILMYHKVAPENKTMWWVDCNSFFRQMAELAGKKVVYLDNYDPCNSDQVVITFDGVYDNVVRFALPILKHFGYPFELFVTGDYIGEGNEFDILEPTATFADITGLRKLVAGGGRLQWHTSSHTDMGEMIDQSRIAAELAISEELQLLDSAGFRWFAYPNGSFSPQVLEKVRQRFLGAVSCHQGSNGDIHTLNRVTVTCDTRLAERRISVIIPSYNYGMFLDEALESVLRQSIPVDEIIIADDCSIDNTAEVASYYSEKYPDLIRCFRNATNLGVVENFNRAVMLATGDYVCIIGADNRIPSNYVYECAWALDSDPTVAVAYTDYALFGPRAEVVYRNYSRELKNGSRLNYFLVRFPEFEEVDHSYLSRQNIMHGSSMFRKSAFDAVGGYRNERDMPEDQNLFLRMIINGWKAAKARKTLLEYRQHSREQINESFIAVHKLRFYMRKCRDLEERYNLMQQCRLWRYFSKVLMGYARLRDIIRRFLSRIVENV